MKAFLALAALLFGGCASIVNAPLNVPSTPAFVAASQQPRDIVGSRVIGLSLSGGGLRASAFAFGVLQALADKDAAGADVYDELTFISSVSGGSLTAAYATLNGRAGLATFRQQVLARDLERDLRQSLLSPVNLARLLAGGLNDRSNLADTLDTDVFRGATFADLARARKPDLWINATDLYNRTPFPFLPAVFHALCSDLSQLRVSEAVAASMAVPLAFSPVVLRTYPEQCPGALPAWVPAAAASDNASVAAGMLASTARALLNYRDAQRMRYVKLVDGGLTDNQGLASILIARAVSGTPYGPLNEADAVRVRRLLFLIVDAGRPATGAWAMQADGPSGVDVGIAAADAAIDSATRLSAAAFRVMLQEWRDSIVRHRCAMPAEQVRRYLEPGQAWRCDDVVFRLGVIGFEGLPAQQAERLRNMPTRLVLPAADIDAAISAGRAAALANEALRAHRNER